jgi:hypothetical protein
MLPFEPGRFSITTGWPSRADSGWPTARAIMSVAPPGGNGRISRIARAG